MADWPQRTALVVGGYQNPTLLGELRRHGFATTQIPSGPGEHTVTASPGRFMIVVVSAGSLLDEEGAFRIRALHRRFPAARVLMEYPSAGRDAEVLVRAERAGVHQVFDADDKNAVDEAIRSSFDGVSLHRERVLAMGAHPTDVEVGCGGALLGHELRGDRISILTLTRGAVDHQLMTVGEAQTTARALGALLLFGDLPCSRVDAGVETVRIIEGVVRAIDPTIVYVHSQHDSNEDHRAVSSAATSATCSVPQVFAYQSPTATNEFQPTRFVPIDDTLQQKIELLRMFHSERGRSHLEPDLVVANSHYWAHLRANAKSAEPFEVIR